MPIPAPTQRTVRFSLQSNSHAAYGICTIPRGLRRVLRGVARQDVLPVGWELACNAALELGPEVGERFGVLGEESVPGRLRLLAAGARGAVARGNLPEPFTAHRHNIGCQEGSATYRSCREAWGKQRTSSGM